MNIFSAFLTQNPNRLSTRASLHDNCTQSPGAACPHACARRLRNLKQTADLVDLVYKVNNFHQFASFVRHKFGQQLFKMALQRTLRRMVSPTKNVLLFCRAQSTGSAAIGILFPRKISFWVLVMQLRHGSLNSGTSPYAMDSKNKEISTLWTVHLVSEN